jgi:thiol-disulfide isomerase/thioredoxin
MKVLAYLSAFLLFAPFSYGETVLLDFTGKYCPPCRQMEPVLAGLEREGYRIEQINVELPESRAKMQQFHVDKIPTFVVVSDGQETGRLVGAVPADSLKKLLGPIAQSRTTKAKTSPASSSKPAELPLTNLAKAERPSDQGLIQRSVRIVVDDAKSRSYGTGTVIRSVPGETLVLTCAHLFQGVSRQAKTTVEFFGLPDRPRLSGEVLASDAKADVCLVRVVYQQAFPAAHVAGRKAVPETGQATTSVGCDNGAEPTVRHMRVTAVNRYVGAPTIECSGEPVEGRSGGGLFNEFGDVIGVCSARDPADHRGIYGGLAAIQALLERNSLASLYESKSAADPAIALAGFESKANGTVALPSPTAMGLQVDRDLPIPHDADYAEVVCVIRSLEDPNAPAKVVLLNRATPEFLTLLEKERAAQATRPSTSMRLPTRSYGQPFAEQSAEATDRAATPSDLSGWRNVRSDTARESKDMLAPEARGPVEESARWQKNWPTGASSGEGPVRR